MSLLNVSSCRKFMLDYAQRSRHHKFTQVNKAVYPMLESYLRKHMRAIVDGQPSKGKTIR